MVFIERRGTGPAPSSWFWDAGGPVTFRGQFESDQYTQSPISANQRRAADDHRKCLMKTGSDHNAQLVSGSSQRKS